MSLAFWPNLLTCSSAASSVFNLGSYDEVNGSSAPHVAYCFADVQGFSKFGSYIGEGSTNGTFVYTGFKPAFVLNKKTDGTMDWHIWDNKRNSFNVINKLHSDSDRVVDIISINRFFAPVDIIFILLFIWQRCRCVRIKITINGY